MHARELLEIINDELASLASESEQRHLMGFNDCF
jgi:hypothetical protein